ncbi:hypothetical protein ACFQU2_28945 [Siccirubricoccus deserti]
MTIILILDDSATNRSIYTRLAGLVEEGLGSRPLPIRWMRWNGWATTGSTW